jgi:hypothetical protein
MNDPAMVLNSSGNYINIKLRKFILGLHFGARNASTTRGSAREKLSSRGTDVFNSKIDLQKQGLKSSGKKKRKIRPMSAPKFNSNFRNRLIAHHNMQHGT